MNAVGTAVVLVGMGLAMFVFVLASEAMQRHPWYFVTLWFYLPVFALWMGRAEESWTSEFAEKVRNRLTLAVLVLGIMLVMYGKGAFDDVAGYLVDGYAVENLPDYVADGGTYRFVVTSGWLATAVLWLLRIAVLLLVVGLPFLTFVGINEILVRRAVDEKLAREEEEESEAFMAEIDSIDVDDPAWEDKVKKKLGL